MERSRTSDDGFLPGLDTSHSSATSRNLTLERRGSIQSPRSLSARSRCSNCSAAFLVGNVRRVLAAQWIPDPDVVDGATPGGSCPDGHVRSASPRSEAHTGRDGPLIEGRVPEGFKPRLSTTRPRRHASPRARKLPTVHPFYQEDGSLPFLAILKRL